MEEEIGSRSSENTLVGLTPSSSLALMESSPERSSLLSLGFDPLYEEEEDKAPFYVGMRAADRKYSLCKEVRERSELDQMLKNFNPGLTHKPEIQVDDYFVDSVREVAVGIPAYMKMWVTNTAFLNREVTWEDFDLHFLSGVSRPRFTLRKVDEDLFVIEIVSHLQGTCVFGVKCCGITLRNSPFHIHAVNPVWSASNSFATVPSQTFCGDTVRVDITCKDQFGYLFPGASETLDISISGPAVIDKMKVKDNKDGSHVLLFKAIKIGRYKIEVSAFEENIRGSPYEILVLPTKPDPNQTKMEGEGSKKAVAGCVHEFVMEPRDKYGNSRLVLKSTEKWNAELVEVNSGETVKVNMTPTKSGKKVLFQCDYRAFKAGKYEMTLSVVEEDGVVLSAVMPNHITVLPGITSGQKSILTVSTLHGYWTMGREQKKIWCLKAGSNLDIKVQSCDKFGNYKYKEISRRSFVSENNQQQWVSGRRPVIHFKIAGSAWSESVAMNTYAKHCIMLDNIEGMGGKTMDILCDVQRRPNGGRLIVLHSCISIVNSLGYSIQIGSYVPLSIEPKCIHVLSPGESFWIPLQICSMGSICLRMVIDGKESSWSQQLRLHELTSKDAEKMKVLGNCIYGKGEITSFTVNVDQNGTQYKLRVEPPVKVRNLLPVPLDTVLYRSGRQLLKSNIKPDSDLNIHNVRNSRQLSLFLKPRGYNWGSGIHIPFSQEGGKLDGEGPVTVATEGSIVVQGTEKDDCPLSIEWKYVGYFPLIIQISCPLWIYNHTGLNLGVCDKDEERKFQAVLPFWKENEAIDSLGVGSVPPKKVKYEPTGLGIIASMAEEDGQITSSSALAEGGSHLPRGPKPANVTSWPTMFGMKAYHHNIKLQVRVKPDARLEKVITSKVFNVQVLGEPTVIQVVASEDQAIPRLPKAYFFTVSTEISTVGGSSIGVHIRPRFILTNKLNVGIMYRQEGSKIKHELHSGGTEAIHADQLSDHPKLCVKLEDSTLWSGFFHLDKSGGIQMKMVGPCEEENMMLQVDVRELSFETWTISVSEYQAGFAPYRIDNFTSDLLSYYQYKCESVEKMLQPYSSAVYTWDEPYMSHKIVIKLPGHGSLGYFPLDAVGANHIVSVPVISGTHLNSSTQRNLQIAVKADGPTRVLAISDLSIHVPRRDRPRLGLPNQLLRITKMKKAKEKEDTHPAKDSVFFLDVQVSHLGLSVIGKASEILYLGISGLQLRFQGGEKHDAISFKTKRIQIDNMLPNATLPVLLSIPAPLYQQESSSSSNEAITCKISYWHAKVASVTCVESAVIKVSPILLDIDGSIFFHLHHFTEVLSWVDETSSLSRVSSASSINGKEEEGTTQKRLHFECIKISPIHMTVSLSTAGLTSEKMFLSENPKGVNAQLLYALAFAEFEGVQVLLSSFELNHALIDKATLQSLMGKHYIRALLREAVKILGSANVLGDPLGLVHHLGTGMWDFLSKPTVGLFQSARTLGVGQFTAGVSAGSWSLLSHTIYALSNAAWKISKTAHRNVNNVKKRCDLLINSSTPVHSRQVESNPSMLGAVSRGIGGIITAPIHGMEQKGLQGLVEGTTLGVLGAFATPTATLLEFAQHTSKVLRDMAKSGILKASRARPPRIVSEDLPLSVYSLNEALGNLLLSSVCNGLYREEDQLFSCLLEEEKKCVLLTNKHVMSVKTTSSYDLSIEWLYSLGDIIEHSREGRAATITILLPFQHDSRESSHMSDSPRDRSCGAGLPISQKVITFATELDSELFEECLLSLNHPDCSFRIALPPSSPGTSTARKQLEM